MQNIASIVQRNSALYQTNCASSVVALAREEMLNRNLHAYTFNFTGAGSPIAVAMVSPANAQRLPAVIYRLSGNSAGRVISSEVLTGKLAEIASWGYVVVAWQQRGVSDDGGHDEDGVLETGRVLISRLLKHLPFVDANNISLLQEGRDGVTSHRPFSCLGLASQAVTVTSLADLRNLLEHSTMTRPENQGKSLLPHQNRQSLPLVPDLLPASTQIFSRSFQPAPQPPP